MVWKEAERPSATLAIMDKGKRVCTECHERPAGLYAYDEAEEFLCDECVQKHPRKFARKDNLPLTHSNDSHFLQRQEAFFRVRDEALGAVEAVDRAIAEVTSKVQEVQAALAAFCTQEVDKLREMKATLAREVPLAVEEVKHTLMHHHPHFSSLYAAALRRCIDSSGPLQLFSFDFDCCQPRDLISLHAHLRPPRPTRLATAYKNEAVLYDISTGQLTNHKLPVNFDDGGSYVELDSDRLLCVGAYPASAAVYECDLTSFRLTSWAMLSTPRSCAGVAKVGAHVYVFGGSRKSENLRSCETAEIAEKEWRALDDMRYARSDFTPCPFRELIYLMCCSESAMRQVETFNVGTEAFSVLPICLPRELKLDCSSVACAVEGELCLLTDYNQMCRWKVDTESQFRLYDSGRDLCSTQPPVIVGSVLLIAHLGSVDRFSLATFSFLEYVEK